MGRAHNSHEHHGHEQKGKDSFMITILLIIFACIFAFAYSNFSAVTAFAAEFLSLTPSDVKMIPVGTALFFVYWQLADRLLFQPFLRVINEREAMTSGASSAAHDTLKEAEQLLTDYDDQILAARVDAMQKKQVALNDCASWSREELAKAANQAQAQIASSRASLAEELKKTQSTMAASISALANDIVAKSNEIPGGAHLV
jgi:F-type H+-transporting ATPase subunit b